MNQSINEQILMSQTLGQKRISNFVCVFVCTHAKFSKFFDFSSNYTVITHLFFILVGDSLNSNDIAGYLDTYPVSFLVYNNKKKNKNSSKGRM